LAGKKIEPLLWLNRFRIDFDNLIASGRLALSAWLFQSEFVVAEHEPTNVAALVDLPSR